MPHRNTHPYAGRLAGPASPAASPQASSQSCLPLRTSPPAAMLPPTPSSASSHQTPLRSYPRPLQLATLPGTPSSLLPHSPAFSSTSSFASIGVAGEAAIPSAWSTPATSASSSPQSALHSPARKFRWRPSTSSGAAASTDYGAPSASPTGLPPGRSISAAHGTSAGALPAPRKEGWLSGKLRKRKEEGSAVASSSSGPSRHAGLRQEAAGCPSSPQPAPSSERSSEQQSHSFSLRFKPGAAKPPVGSTATRSVALPHGPWSGMTQPWPLNAQSEVPCTAWADFTALYAAGYVDLSNPPWPVQLLRRSTFLGPSLAQRSSDGSTRTPEERPRRSGSSRKKKRRPSTAPSSGPRGALSAGPSPFPPPSLPLPALPSRLRSSRHSREATEELRSSAEMPDEERQTVWEVSTQDDDELSPTRSPAEPLAAADGAIKSGMRAPVPNFEQARLQSLMALQPSRFYSSAFARDGASLPTPHITLGLEEELQTQDEAADPIEALRNAAARAVEALLCRCKSAARARFVWVEAECLGVVAEGETDEFARRWELERATSLEAHVILNRGEQMVVLDTLADPRFAHSEAARVGVVFYVGVPILSEAGLPLGVLSLSEVVAREVWTPAEGRLLAAMAREVEGTIAKVRELDHTALCGQLIQSFAKLDRALSSHLTSLDNTAGAGASPSGRALRAVQSRSPGSSLHSGFGSVSVPAPGQAVSSIADEVTIDERSTGLNRIAPAGTSKTAAPLEGTVRAVAAALRLDAVYFASAGRTSHILAACGLPSAALEGIVELDSRSHTSALHAPLVYQDVRVASRERESLPWWCGSGFVSGMLVSCSTDAVEPLYPTSTSDPLVVLVGLSRERNRVFRTAELEYLQKVAGLAAPLLPAPSRALMLPSALPPLSSPTPDMRNRADKARDLVLDRDLRDVSLDRRDGSGRIEEGGLLLSGLSPSASTPSLAASVESDTLDAASSSSGLVCYPLPPRMRAPPAARVSRPLADATQPQGHPSNAQAVQHCQVFGNERAAEPGSRSIPTAPRVDDTAHERRALESPASRLLPAPLSPANRIRNVADAPSPLLTRRGSSALLKVARMRTLAAGEDLGASARSARRGSVDIRRAAAQEEQSRAVAGASYGPQGAADELDILAQEVAQMRRERQRDQERRRFGELPVVHVGRPARDTPV